VKIRILKIVFSLLILLTVENIAQQTIWYSPLDFVGESTNLNISPSTFTTPFAAAITSTTVGNGQMIILGLNLHSGYLLDSLIIYYQVSNPASYITMTRLAKMTYPNQASVVLDNGTDLTSTTPARFAVAVVNQQINGLISLGLFLNITNTADVIYLGAIAVVVSQSTTSSPEENAVELIQNFNLEQNYPNPFNPSTRIDYDISTSDLVKILIYNSNGELLRNLVNEFHSVGKHSNVWDGKDDNGDIVSSGVYYYQLLVGDLAQAKKMILIK
jgi:hypothetical protein